MKRLAALLAAALLLPTIAAAGEPGLLWRVVQTCVATHKLIGTAFPCLAVSLSGGPERGFAVVRAPFEATHVVVTPTVRTIGIEAEQLRADDAPNYFADAWTARHFVADGLRHEPTRTDLAMAVNSRPGRSHDQLHIHVDCIRQDVKRTLSGQLASFRPGSWTKAVVLPRAPHYSATALEEGDLASTNIFKLVQNGLGVAAEDMEEVTIVVVGADVHRRPGFIVLARRRIANTRDEAHGEALMDHACSAFQ